jgi:anti-sigma B factor antagonist
VGVSSEIIGDVVAITPACDYLDVENSPTFKREVTAAIGQHTRVVLDLHKIEFIDSCGCGALISLLRQLKGSSGDIKLCALTGPVRSVLELVRMHKVFDIFNKQEEAVRAYQV